MPRTAVEGDQSQSPTCDGCAGDEAGLITGPRTIGRAPKPTLSREWGAGGVFGDGHCIVSALRAGDGACSPEAKTALVCSRIEISEDRHSQTRRRSTSAESFEPSCWAASAL